ncbi:MAG: DUF4296 domain-containing protein [Cyclobacteriaceae bacterium]|nr:DUF4296 domain-containing protein [Cyclobacteriaceae bacterium]MCB0498152.1 DUF4296 domain-containing protein [Cyclobacteriaceae bacterium]MCO5270595.1 DUF4296 domain-containing protein [Cyclobacteriaceae bacterium]MCW5900964.1 DUF4296 domain-containing protein [Cyclobacteriaceae bacterium]
MTGWAKYLAIVAVVVLPQCRQEERPAGLLDKDEMVALLVDVYLSEAKVTVAGVPRDSAYKLFAHFDRSVTVSRGIADSTLTASYEYYFQRPEELEKILDAVIDTLNLREQRMAGTPD